VSLAGADGRHRPVWIRSSYSNGAGGECVECASVVEAVLVRDSKCLAGPVIAVGDDAWRAFLGSLPEALT